MNRTIPDRVTDICLQFPEARVETVEDEQHLIYRVRKRTFAYYVYDHHGDGEVAVICKVDSGMNVALAEGDPGRFYLPSYLHHKGWISVRLNLAETDWEEVGDLLEMSYSLIAPVTLIRKMK